MQKAKLDVLMFMPCYGGNGGVATQIPHITEYCMRLVGELAKDPRIGRFTPKSFADTPITMSRNYAVELAIEGGYDVLFMLDSDNEPDCLLGGPKQRPDAKPFWQSSFDFLYEKYIRGIPSVVAAPYVGPGDDQCVYAFQWEDKANSRFHDGEHSAYGLRMYTRYEAALMRGIQPAGAGATGCILYSIGARDATTNAFSYMKQPYFDYEWQGEKGRCAHCQQSIPGPRAKKASTEDCYNTREISMGCLTKSGFKYNPFFINWDAWAAHMKPERCMPPVGLYADDVSRSFHAVARENVRSDQKTIFLQSGEANFFPDRVIRDEPTPAPEPVKAQDESYLRNGHRILPLGQRVSEERLTALGDAVSLVAADVPGRALRILDFDPWVGETCLALADHSPEDSLVFAVTAFNGDELGTDAPSEARRLLVATWGETFFANTSERVNNGTIRPVSPGTVAKLEPQEVDLAALPDDPSAEMYEMAEKHVREGGLLVYRANGEWRHEIAERDTELAEASA